ncbi:hypothetical protein [Lysobacter gummosus]|uniref:Uncharacterized protein n=1 Tax=Lysobacter gummosus TaxID=262324 RepID=A0ABY3XAH8_9GAMM|nr:hypothetical protein [Lysobacter gummosus]UNP29578.1 hypothetical protein MOV92_24515 [Lysobacter gummosus]
MADIEWGSIADWVSGIGSLTAATVALYVAHSSQRVRLRAHCGHRLIIGIDHPREDVFTVTATNVSQRPTVVTNIGFTFGVWRWKQHGIFNFIQDDIGHGIPKPLVDGESGTWSARLGPDNHWVKDLVEKLQVNWWSVLTWRIHIHTSNGGTTTVRPERNIRDMLLAEIAARKIS